MAQVIITFKIMPENPDVDLEKVHVEALKKIAGFAGEGETKKDIEPVAFGLNALKIIFVSDETKGGTEELEKDIETIEGVNSVEVIDVRRALG